MARKKGEVRPIITLACGDCRERNYTSVKNQRSDPQRLSRKPHRKVCERKRYG